ncbi:MAG: hypothetical protein IPK18_02755 [Sphingobacteriales bacterium]|nr:MAG: hypothetical protein IPK18_02755 [Sphingobacteriales bacterium]
MFIAKVFSDNILELLSKFSFQGNVIALFGTCFNVYFNVSFLLIVSKTDAVLATILYVPILLKSKILFVLKCIVSFVLMLLDINSDKSEPPLT